MTEAKPQDEQEQGEALQEVAEETSTQEDIVDEEVTLLSSELDKLKNEAEEFKDKYWRLLAETENSRKRMQKERQELTKYALQGAILDFLHPLDTLENALKGSQHASDEVKNWAMGFEMILSQFKDVLGNHDVKAFSAEGQVFDPHHHEAVETVETDEQPEGTILHQFVQGYKMGDRTIRPARVKVARPVKKEELNQDHQKEKQEQDKE